MNIVKNWGVLFVIVGVLLGCGQEYDYKGRIFLVEVVGEYFYKEDLQVVLFFYILKDDSVLFVEYYIKNWVEDVLFFDKVEGNIFDNVKIVKLVENYCRVLIMYMYQEELVNQKLVNEISDEEISVYYEKNKELFYIEYFFVKGLFIKVFFYFQDLVSVCKWYKKNNWDVIESLEKYSLCNVVSYDYFYDCWMLLFDIVVKIFLKVFDMDENYLDKNWNIEVKDMVFCYFLYVEEFLGKD